MKTFIVENEETGKRIDAYLAKKDNDISRVAVQRLIKEEKILVNDKKVKSSYKVQEGDSITVEEEQAKEIELKAQDIPVEIIYEDSDIIVVNKPKGLVVHPGSGNPDGTLVNSLMNICKDSLSGIGGEIRPGIVHRLDKDTSGILVAAKNDKSHINLSEQIKNREVKKTYIALVRGFVKENEATINMPIGRSPKDRKKMAVVKNGKNAITHIKVLERFNNMTLVEYTLETGRTHQLRVHSKYIGHPIVGDSLYGLQSPLISRQALHAYEVSFVHPINKEKMLIHSDLPDDIKKLIDANKI